MSHNHKQSGFEDLYESEDYKRGMSPYFGYFQALGEVLDFRQVESFADVGCCNGRLLEASKREYPHLKVLGLDYFEWAKNFADPLVSDSIKMADLRETYSAGMQYDVVNCTEVGEHLPKESEGMLLENLVNMTKRWLILSWSDEINPQHFNPRSIEYIASRLEEKGFVLLNFQTNKFRKGLKMYVNEHGFQWWSQSVAVFERKQNNMHQKFWILGTRNTDTGSLDGYKHGLLSVGNFQEGFLKLKDRVLESVGKRKFLSVVRFGDGDFHFLMRSAKGSAAVGRRGTTIPYDQIDTKWFQYWFFRNNIMTLELQVSYRLRYALYLFLHPVFWNWHVLKSFVRGIGDLQTVVRNYFAAWFKVGFGGYIPFEGVYALVSTRWVFRAFPNEIALIGSAEKMELIEKLCGRSEYREYLGIDSFADLIPIPQKGAADKPKALLEEIGAKIKNSKAKVFLVGAGHAKTGLLANFAQYSNAVFIDVGTGIDALAGCINHERPYFADWVNFRFKGLDYSKVDQMDFEVPRTIEGDYKTVWLDN